MVDKNNSSEIPTLDPEEVIKALITTKAYNENGNMVKLWTLTLDPKKKNLSSLCYLAELKQEANLYYGLVDAEMSRENIGIHKYTNGDFYLGNWKGNCRNGAGVYLHNKPVVKKQVNIEMYMGNWTDDYPNTEGVYCWISEKEGNNDFLKCEFEAFVGSLNDGSFNRGIYLTKVGSKFIIYYGEFRNGKKHDSKCYFYDNDGTIDRVFRGKITDDVVENGFFVSFHKDDIDDSIYLKFKDNTPVEVCSKDKLDEKTLKQINKECLNFREILLEDDWFGLVYDTVKAVYNKIKTFKTDDFNNDKLFNELTSVASSYLNVTVYSNLCEKMSKN